MIYLLLGTTVFLFVAWWLVNVVLFRLVPRWQQQPRRRHVSNAMGGRVMVERPHTGVRHRPRRTKMEVQKRLAKGYTPSPTLEDMKRPNPRKLSFSSVAKSPRRPHSHPSSLVSSQFVASSRGFLSVEPTSTFIAKALKRRDLYVQRGKNYHHSGELCEPEECPSALEDIIVQGSVPDTPYASSIYRQVSPRMSSLSPSSSQEQSHSLEGSPIEFGKADWSPDVYRMRSTPYSTPDVPLQPQLQHSMLPMFRKPAPRAPVSSPSMSGTTTATSNFSALGEKEEKENSLGTKTREMERMREQQVFGNGKSRRLKRRRSASPPSMRTGKSASRANSRDLLPPSGEKRQGRKRESGTQATILRTARGKERGRAPHRGNSRSNTNARKRERAVSLSPATMRKGEDAEGARSVERSAAKEKHPKRRKKGTPAEQRRQTEQRKRRLQHKVLQKRKGQQGNGQPARTGVSTTTIGADDSNCSHHSDHNGGIEGDTNDTRHKRNTAEEFIMMNSGKDKGSKFNKSSPQTSPSPMLLRVVSVISGQTKGKGPSTPGHGEDEHCHRRNLGRRVRIGPFWVSAETKAPPGANGNSKETLEGQQDDGKAVTCIDAGEGRGVGDLGTTGGQTLGHAEQGKDGQPRRTPSMKNARSGLGVSTYGVLSNMLQRRVGRSAERRRDRVTLPEGGLSQAAKDLLTGKTTMADRARSLSRSPSPRGRVPLVGRSPQSEATAATRRASGGKSPTKGKPARVESPGPSLPSLVPSSKADRKSNKTKAGDDIVSPLRQVDHKYALGRIGKANSKQELAERVKAQADKKVEKLLASAKKKKEQREVEEQKRKEMAKRSSLGESGDTGALQSVGFTLGGTGAALQSGGRSLGISSIVESLSKDHTSTGGSSSTSLSSDSRSLASSLTGMFTHSAPKLSTAPSSSSALRSPGGLNLNVPKSLSTAVPFNPSSAGGMTLAPAPSRSRPQFTGLPSLATSSASVGTGIPPLQRQQTLGMSAFVAQSQGIIPSGGHTGGGVTAGVFSLGKTSPSRKGRAGRRRRKSR